MKAVRIPLRDGGYTLVDECDEEQVRKHEWKLDNLGYAYASMFSGFVRLHSWLIRAPGGKFVVDHENRNRLDNRRSNLRICTAKENAQNRTPRGIPEPSLN